MTNNVTFIKPQQINKFGQTNIDFSKVYQEKFQKCAEYYTTGNYYVAPLNLPAIFYNEQESQTVLVKQVLSVKDLFGSISSLNSENEIQEEPKQHEILTTFYATKPNFVNAICSSKYFSIDKNNVVVLVDNERKEYKFFLGKEDNNGQLVLVAKENFDSSRKYFWQIMDSILPNKKVDQINPMEKIVNDKIVKNKCINFYRVLPWRTNTVSRIFISPVELENIFYDNTVPTKFLNTNLVFYPVKKSYYYMRCDSIKQTIENDTSIITLTTKSENTYKFIVGFTEEGFKDKIIVMDQNLFLLEQNFSFNYFQETNDLDFIKKNPVTKDLFEVAVSQLTSFTSNKNYSTSIMNAINETSKNAEMFALKVSELTTLADFGGNFFNKLSNEEYNETFFADFKVKDFDQDLKYDKNKFNLYVSKMADRLLLFSVQGFIQQRLYQRDTIKQVPFSFVDLKSKCINPEEIKNVPTRNIVFDISRKCYDYEKILQNLNSNLYPDEVKEQVKVMYKERKTKKIDLYDKLMEEPEKPAPELPSRNFSIVKNAILREVRQLETLLSKYQPEECSSDNTQQTQNNTSTVKRLTCDGCQNLINTTMNFQTVDVDTLRKLNYCSIKCYNPNTQPVEQNQDRPNTIENIKKFFQKQKKQDQKLLPK